MKMRNAVLIRAPPRSGKTALIALFERYVKKTQPDAQVRFCHFFGVNTHTIHFQVVCASFLKITGPLGPGSVSSFLYSFGLNAEVLLAEGQKPLYVLLDETQSVYHVSDDFWSRTLKSLFGYNPKCKTRILLFAAHGGVQRTGLTTPFDPVGNELTIAFLRYRRVHELLQTAYFLNPSLSL